MCSCWVELAPHISLLSIYTLKEYSVPLGSLPHHVAIISVEVGGQLLLVVHTTGLNGIREAQRSEGQIHHGLLHQLDMTAASRCIGLRDKIQDNVAP